MLAEMNIMKKITPNHQTTQANANAASVSSVKKKNGNLLGI